jgi:formylglycine-generating enzyme required for sulfatase activity
MKKICAFGLSALCAVNGSALGGTIPTSFVPGGDDPGGVFGGRTYEAVPYGFSISTNLVSQLEFFEVMGTYPSAYNRPDRDVHPVERVSWIGTATFANLKSIADGFEPVYGADWTPDYSKNGWRLPTVDEWFKAAAWDPTRGGTGGYWTYGFGRDSFSPADANYWASGDPFETTGNPRTTPVGFYDGSLYNPGGGGPTGDGSEFITNPNSNYYGIHDLSGNVREWTNTREAPTNNNYVVHSSAWGDVGLRANWERVGGFDWNHASDSIGFHLVRVPEPATGLALGLLGLLALRRR